MKVTSVIDIKELIRYRRSGESQRTTAEALGIARNTVAGYEREVRKRGWLDPNQPMPDEAAIAQMLKEMFTPTARTISKLEPHRTWIEAQRQAGVSIAKIWRELNQSLKVKCAYSAVWGYMRLLEGPTVDVTVRVETAPGEEGQVDFGYAGWMYDPLVKRLRKAWGFVMTLSYSRHLFVKFVFDQTTATWLRLHREGFEFFGGVPGRVKLDNLKAAIIRASLDDPLVQRAYRELAEYYGFLISPCRVRKPQHKGKVESGVKYVKSDFLAGTDYTREDRHIGHANADVRAWALTVAGHREHGTTHWHPMEEFERAERAALKVLPETPYEAAVWTTALLHRDCYVVLDKRYYSAPYRYIGQRLNVRMTDRKVQLYAGYDLIATHSRQVEVGKRQTNSTHLPEYKVAGLAPRTAIRDQAGQIGPYTAALVDRLMADRAIDRHGTAQRLIRLASKHDKAVLERACQEAFECGDATPATVRNMITVITSGRVAPVPAPAAAPAFARSIEDLAPAHALAYALAPTLPTFVEARTEVAA